MYGVMLKPGEVAWVEPSPELCLKLSNVRIFDCVLSFIHISSAPFLSLNFISVPVENKNQTIKSF